MENLKTRVCDLETQVLSLQEMLLLMLKGGVSPLQLRDKIDAFYLEVFENKENKMKNRNQTTDETLMISHQRYKELTKASNLLEALRAAGVDNWSGYEHARELYTELEDEEELNFDED